MAGAGEVQGKPKTRLLSESWSTHGLMGVCQKDTGSLEGPSLAKSSILENQKAMVVMDYETQKRARGGFPTRLSPVVGYMHVCFIIMFTYACRHHKRFCTWLCSRLKTLKRSEDALPALHLIQLEPATTAMLDERRRKSLSFSPRRESLKTSGLHWPHLQSIKILYRV